MIIIIYYCEEISNPACTYKHWLFCCGVFGLWVLSLQLKEFNDVKEKNYWPTLSKVTHEFFPGYSLGPRGGVGGRGMRHNHILYKYNHVILYLSIKAKELSTSASLAFDKRRKLSQPKEILLGADWGSSIQRHHYLCITRWLSLTEQNSPNRSKMLLKFIGLRCFRLEGNMFIIVFLSLSILSQAVEVDEAVAGADSEVVVEVDSVVGEEEVASVVDPEEAVDLEVWYFGLKTCCFFQGC